MKNPFYNSHHLFNRLLVGKTSRLGTIGTIGMGIDSISSRFMWTRGSVIDWILAGPATPAIQPLHREFGNHDVSTHNFGESIVTFKGYYLEDHPS